MSCENKLTNLVFKNKENSARTTMCFLFPSFLPPLFFYIYRIKKTPRMKCNATPRDRREKHKNKGTKNNGHKGKVMKLKDHVRKTQLV